MKDNGRKIDFVFIKATQGVSLIDPYLRANCDSAEVHKMIKGVYHYFEPETDGKEQAMHFLKHANISKGDLLPVVDVEQLDGADHIELRDRLKDWLDTVEGATGVKPIIYTGAKFHNSYLAGVFSSYPLWVAHYTEATEPGVNRDWHFWQYSERATVDGISGYVDFNVFNGDSMAFGRVIVK
jgi:lysozyme